MLFSGSKELEKGIVERIERAPREVGPFDAVVAAFAAAGAQLEEHRELPYVRARWALVTEHAEIQERELIKLSSLATAVTKALEARGVEQPAASLAAEAGIAVFKVGFERWIAEKKPHDLAAHIRAAAKVLRKVASEPTTRAPKPAPRKKPTK